ncbi:hypothetical protein [Lactobacillus sp. 3B(2020)]|uniref:hypothetical protein n=1 Tax=Lactobacillus sp. 3B(2020) TaxID=2695882 RepID=UPI0015DDCAA5|nr:hypothetical protein [Lactobacillus sp. 3B(2020)]QLL69461.1 hypothetical protein GTO83_02345 [Lactobacillus sp. 3B(2020)]
MRKNLKVMLGTVAIAALLAGCGQATTSKKAANSSSTPKVSKTTGQKQSRHQSSQTKENVTTVTDGSLLKSAASVAPASYNVATKTLTTNRLVANTTSSNPIQKSNLAVTATSQTAKATQASKSNQTVVAPEKTDPQVTLATDQLSQNQKFGLYVWYTSKEITNESLPTTERPISVTAMNESSVLAPLPNGTNNTYYQVYGSTADNGEWVNYYAQGKDVAGVDPSVYVYHQNQWQQYQVGNMVQTANQQNAGNYVNQLANNVQMHDER